MKELNRNFPLALPDLICLLDRGYPKKPSIELVGNRYRLSADERMVLYRGVYPGRICRERKKKLVLPDVLHTSLLVADGYNLLITVESYLAGRRVFRSLDGFLRDVAGVYGNHTFGEETMRSTGLFLDFLEEWKADRCIVYLDRPVSKSGEYARYLRGRLEERSLDGTVEAVPSPDRRIASEHTDDIVASADTVIIDGVSRCIDIPGHIIRERFGGDVLDLERMVSSYL